MRHRLIVLTLVVVACAATLPARGGAASGTCTATVHFNFATKISNTAGPTTYSMNGSGSCQTSAQAGAAKTMAFGTIQGQATSAQCGALVLQGPYSVTFNPDPAPGGGSGQSNFFGTASGGVWVWTGSNPTLVGIGILAGGGALPCATGGTNSLTFSMSFTFVDP